MSKPTTIYDLSKLNLSPGTYSIKVRAISNDSNYTESDDSNIVQFTIEAEDTSALIYDFTGDDVIVQLTPANKRFVDLKIDGIYFNNERVYEIHNYIGLSNNANSDIIGKDVKGEVLNIGSTNLQLSSNEGNSSYYTRNGAFSIDKNGYLVNPSNGYKVQGWNGTNNTFKMVKNDNYWDAKNVKTKEILTKVYQALEEKGYNPINQIVGYILSGDPTYITSHNNARNLIRQLERDELLEKMVRNYIGLGE